MYECNKNWCDANTNVEMLKEPWVSLGPPFTLYDHVYATSVAE